MAESCLIGMLSHYMPLDDASRDHLAALEKTERAYGKGVEIYQGGDPNDELYVVKSGWLYSYTLSLDGRRQIVKLHHPGDIIGFPDIALTERSTVLRTAEPVCLCPFPKRGLEEIFRTSPKLTALLFSLSARDQVILIDRLRAMGRMSARERLAYLLLDLLHKLRITDAGITDTIRVPMTQGEIADVIGLTNVYVSRSFIALEEAGMIRRSENRIRILRESALVALSDFVDRYASLDTSWFPEPE